MIVQLALYKARGNWINRLICWWTGSPYSHCELVINGTCYSSSIRDGGVRGKTMALPSDKWDAVPDTHLRAHETSLHPVCRLRPDQRNQNHTDDMHTTNIQTTT